MSKELDLVAAYADTTALGEFDGRQVVRSTIEVTNAGDGLSKAMAVEPVAMPLGTEVYLVLRGEVTKVGIKPLDQDDEDSALVRVHTIRAGDATILDDAGVKKIQKSVDGQADRIKRAIEAAKGIDRLPGTDDPPADDESDDDDVAEPTPIR